MMQSLSSVSLAETFLDLGGKDAVLISAGCGDDLLKIASQVCESSFYYSGQNSAAVRRVFVQGDDFDRFCEILKDLAKNLVLGNPNNQDVQVSALISNRNQAKLLEQEAVEKGAKLIFGAESYQQIFPNNLFPPTILTNTTDQMKIMQEETFGPVLVVNKIDNLEDAVLRINNNVYGQGCSLFCKSKELALKIANQLQVGQVSWNKINEIEVNMPWTGWKKSGQSFVLSRFAFDELTTPKVLNFKKE